MWVEGKTRNLIRVGPEVEKLIRMKREPRGNYRGVVKGGKKLREIGKKR